MPVKLDRRTFLSRIPTALSVASLATHARPLLVPDDLMTNVGETCWHEVVAPFVVEQPSAGIRSEIILTSDTFSGRRGYLGGDQSTEYELCLYHSDGKAIGADGVARRLAVAAMSPVVIPLRDLVGEGKDFFGGLKVRLRPRNSSTHVSDLFSSAFVRWTTDSSFDNIHANPDPLQWQIKESFFYSMPFPPMNDYECYYGLFNPYGETSHGEIAIHDAIGRKRSSLRYELKARTSLLLDVGRGEFFNDAAAAFAGRPSEALTAFPGGGTIAVTNAANSVKNFGFMLIKQRSRPRFSFEHPIHQGSYRPTVSIEPFDKADRLKVKNILYTPLVFRSKSIGGISLNSRFHLSSGAPIEESLWLSPFVTDANGEVSWQFSKTEGQKAMIAPSQVKRGAIKLGAQQSCVLDCSKMGLPDDFSGGLSLAIAPLSNHTLMKAEVTVPEWGAHAFTHFRPGLSAARTYQTPDERGGLVTDYVSTGAALERRGREVLRDEILSIVNIDGAGLAGKPVVEVFGLNGLIARLGPLQIPTFACRHFLLSELMPGESNLTGLTLRLVDDQTVLLMSLIHLDYLRRDLALDHGSDRFSTYLDFNCKVEK